MFLQHIRVDMDIIETNYKLLVQNECRPCNFICNDCNIIMYRCLNGTDVYFRKINNIEIYYCEECINKKGIETNKYQ